MKKLQLRIVLLSFITFFICGTAFSANEQFRSIATGNWNANSTWEMSTNSGSTWFAATSTPRDTSGAITVRSPDVVTVTVSVPADQLTVNTGATLSINTGIVFTLLNGTGDDFTLNSGGTVSGAGTFQTQGTLAVNLRTGSSFNAAFKVNTGTATVNDQSSPFNGRLYGSLTVDAGATLSVGTSGAHRLEAYGTVLNNGTITQTGGSAPTFVLMGPSLVNNSSVSIANLRINSTSTISGAGSYTGGLITIDTSGNVSLLSDVTFSTNTGFNINTGGVFNPNGFTLTQTSGLFTIFSGGTVTNSGTYRTQGTVGMNLRTGSNFNAPLKVNTGSTTANDQSSPFNGRLYGSLTVDAGATLSVGTSGAHRLEAYGTVLNNGTITQTGGSAPTFVLMGPSLVNNNTVSIANLRINSTSTISGAGTFTGGLITIDTSGNVSLSSNISFSTSTGFNINAGGVFNPNGFTFTQTSGTFTIFSGGTVTNSGTYRTQGTVALNLRTGSNFNAPLKVNTGTTTANDLSSPFNGRLYGSLTVDAGATLSIGNSSAYKLEAYGNVVNNGTIAATSSTPAFILRGPSLVNNNSITIPIFTIDSAVNISGAGTFTSSNININSAVTILNNITLSPLLAININTGGSINPNSNILTITNGDVTLSNGASILNSGSVKTQGTVSLNLRNGSAFNAFLNVLSGTTSATDLSSPFIGRLFGQVTIDNGAVLSTGTSSAYKLEIYGNMTNNGTIGGNTGSELFFTSGLHTLQGTGKINIPVTIFSGATVTLASNHNMFSVKINAGGIFDISNRLLGLTFSDPISQNGTFTTTGSKIEYNGTALQSVSVTNINYYTLRINNPAGALLLGDITIPDSLRVILGDLNLNGKIITLSPAAYMTETPGNTVFGTLGYITTTRTIGIPSSLNVGGIGAVLTATTNLGSTVVRRGHTVQTGLNGGTSIKRYYDITPTNNTGLTASLVYKFDDSELNGKPEPSLKLFKSTNTGSTWLYQGGFVNIATNEITLPGVTSFSRWSADSSKVSAAIGLIMEGFYNIATNNLNMTDTVRAYLRNTSSPYAIVDSSKGLLDSLTFKSAFQFSNASTGSYYIQLKHRNSLETWSKNGVFYVQDSTLNYDFTFAANQAFGNNETLKGTKYCLYSGDVSQDGNIDLTDVVLTYNSSSSFATGYVNTDVNGNSIVDLTDVLIVSNNASKFIVRKSPLNP